MWHDINFKFGITEQGDAGLDFSWTKHMDAVIGAIIISKTANDDLIDELLKYKNKVIYHATCTGLGSTKIEPNVPSVKEKFEHLQKLINYGFPPDQIVVRIDPLFPPQWINVINDSVNIDYILKIENILSMTQELGIKRVRYSYLDIHDYVLSRLQNISKNFLITGNIGKGIYENEIQLLKMNPNFEYETCCETYVPYIHQIGCISDKDLKILKLNIKYECDYKNNNFRDSICKCPFNNKLELISNNNFKCDHNCQYCYWRIAKIDKSTNTKIYGNFREK